MRWLAPKVYLDVVPLTLEAGGALRVAGAGTVVDWLVQMQELASGSLLDSLLARRAATPAQLQAVAARLAEFHRARRCCATSRNASAN